MASRRRRLVAPAAARAAAAVAAAVTTATTAAARAGLAGLGFVDGEGAAVLLLPVEGGDGGLGLLVAAHLDEAEALAPAGVTVLDHFRALDRAVRAAHLLQVRAGGVVTEIPDVQFAAH